MGWRRVAVYLYISTRCQRHYLWDYLQHYLREMQFSGFVPQCTLAGGSCCASLPPLFVCLPHQVGWGGTTGVLLAVVVVEVRVVVGVEVVVDILVICLTAIKCAKMVMQTVQAFIIAHYCIIAIICTSTLCCRCGHKSFFCFQMFAWSQVYKVPRSGSAMSKNLWIHQQIWCKSQIILQESETAINLQRSALFAQLCK